jgi:type VI secretion system secreted protein VgrG
MPFKLDLDIETALQVLFFLSVVGVILAGIAGWNSIRTGSKLMFFRKRRDMIMRGWRMIILAVILAAVAFSLNQYARPMIYRVFPPSPTITLTPTITQTPTISLTPTITFTPTITLTPMFSPTPLLPTQYLKQFTGQKTPDPAAVFSSLQFSRKIEGNLPVEPLVEFANPVIHLYGSFSYDKMTDGAQWTAIWKRGDDIICDETKPWDGGTGGYGYTDCMPAAEQWLPGQYEIQVFLGTQYITGGVFTVTGDAPTITRTPVPTKTTAPTSTRLPSITPVPSKTSVIKPTDTRQPTITPKNTWTSLPPTLKVTATSLAPDVIVITVTGTPPSGLIP